MTASNVPGHVTTVLSGASMVWHSLPGVAPAAFWTCRFGPTDWSSAVLIVLELSLSSATTMSSPPVWTTPTVVAARARPGADSSTSTDERTTTGSLRSTDPSVSADWGCADPPSSGRSVPTAGERTGRDRLPHIGLARVVPEPRQAPRRARRLPLPEVRSRDPLVDHDLERVAALRAHLGHELGERLRPRQVDREDAVPPQRPPHRPPVRPARRDPHRNPRLLHRHGLELAAPQRHQPVEVGVELPRALAHVRLLAERPELAVRIAAHPHTEHQPPLAQAVECDRLARELVDPPPRRRGDERPDPHPRRRRRDRRHRHPRVGDVGHRRAVDHVIPDEEAVPPGRLRLGRELCEHARLGQLPERGDEDRSLGRHSQPRTGKVRRRARVSMPSWIDCWTSSYLRSTYSSSFAFAGSRESLTGGWKAVRILVGSGSSGSIAGEIPHGAWIEIGNIFSRATLSSCSALASRRPRASTGIESGPPTVAIGTIGTPARIAIRMKPLRPASTAWSRSVHGRSESISPPGHSATSCPASSAEAIESGAAGSTPILRK